MSNVFDGYRAYFNRLSYAIAKIGTDTLKNIPHVGPSVVNGVSRACDELHWASDYVAQERTEQSFDLCVAAKDTMAEQQLGELPPPVDATAPIPRAKEVPGR